jgi:hypothetical protein
MAILSLEALADIAEDELGVPEIMYDPAVGIFGVEVSHVLLYYFYQRYPQKTPYVRGRGLAHSPAVILIRTDVGVVDAGLGIDRQRLAQLLHRLSQAKRPAFTAGW